MNTIFPKYFKHSLIRLVSIVTILSFVLSNIAFALPASPSGGPDTLRPKQPLQQRPEVVQGLGVELLQGAGKTQPPAQGAFIGADRQLMSPENALSGANKFNSVLAEANSDLREAARAILSDPEVQIMNPSVTAELGGELISIHFENSDNVELFFGIIIYSKYHKLGIYAYRRTGRGIIWRKLPPLIADNSTMLVELAKKILESERQNSYWQKSLTMAKSKTSQLSSPPAQGGTPNLAAGEISQPTDSAEQIIARKQRQIDDLEMRLDNYRADLIGVDGHRADVYDRIVMEEMDKLRAQILKLQEEIDALETTSSEAEYFIGGLQVNWDIWEFVPGNPNQIWQKVDHSVRAQRGPNGFEMFGGGLAAGTGESEQPLDTPQQMRLAEGETDFAKELRGDVLPQAPAPDIKSMVDEAIKQADQAAQAVKSAPKAPATGAITLSPADDEPQLFVGSTGDEEFEPFHSAVFKAQEIYEQGGKTQEAARKASEALISYLIKMHNMDYPVNLDYAIFILKNAGNPDLLPIVAVLEEFQAGPKDDAGELLANLKAAIIDSLQEELRGLREQELTLSRTDEVVLRIPTYLRREELDKIGQRREEINAQLERLTAASFLKAIDNWQMSEEWPGISVKDKGVQTYVVNLPYDYSEPEVLLTSLRAELGAGVNIVVRLRGADEKTFSYYRKFNLGLDLKLGIEAIEQVDENMLSQALRGIEVKPGEKHLFIIEKENYSGLKSEEAILSNMQQVNANLKVALVQKTDLEQPTDASRKILKLFFGPNQVEVITPETITSQELRQELTTALAALRKA